MRNKKYDDLDLMVIILVLTIIFFSIILFSCTSEPIQNEYQLSSIKIVENSSWIQCDTSVSETLIEQDGKYQFEWSNKWLTPNNDLIEFPEGMTIDGYELLSVPYRITNEIDSINFCGYTVIEKWLVHPLLDSILQRTEIKQFINYKKI